MSLLLRTALCKVAEKSCCHVADRDGRLNLLVHQAQRPGIPIPNTTEDDVGDTFCLMDESIGKVDEEDLDRQLRQLARSKVARASRQREESNKRYSLMGPDSNEETNKRALGIMWEKLMAADGRKGGGRGG